VSTEELWIESYQGEVVGEALFGAMAEREEDPVRRHQLTTLTLLERATKDLAESVFERRALDRGDSDASVAIAKQLADAMAELTWQDFLASIGSRRSRARDRRGLCSPRIGSGRLRSTGTGTRGG
jgi:hypothetical protein